MLSLESISFNPGSITRESWSSVGNVEITSTNSTTTIGNAVSQEGTKTEITLKKLIDLS
ncbi:MAG: hypothetical protein IPI93_14530 [Sphingobacteriaceae bacterium]|nr:hypothetical protein [Sphingobacteriaceae bacterium]